MAVFQVLWSSVAEEAYGSEKGMLGGLKIRSLKDDTVRHMSRCLVLCFFLACSFAASCTS
jgi:hypothetical protein